MRWFGGCFVEVWGGLACFHGHQAIAQLEHQLSEFESQPYVYHNKGHLG